MADTRLLLADVDGTLVTKEKHLTPRAIAAVRALRERGIEFAVTSGRPPRGMAMLIEPLAITTPIAAFNGGLFVNADMSILEAHTLPPEVAAQALDAILKAGLDAWIYRGEEWWVRDTEAPHVAREQWTVKFAPLVTNDLASKLEGAVKIVGISDDIPLMERTERAVQEALGKAASAARSQPYYLDVTHASANKGGVVDWLAARLGIPAATIATIGDQPNDVLMFRRGGLAIAMGQAADDVKREAREVTTSSEEEGFANAVERFILGADHG
jgi:Cof subfamily protein (haloacid dehalogenase superfamily)